MNIHSIYELLGRRFRRRRAQQLRIEFADCKSIVDLGGEPESWGDWKPERLILLNIHSFKVRVPGAEHIQGDALALPLRDKCVDLVMSNSVIEHVPDQTRFAAETMRVGTRIYCQTPSKWFPIEPHVLTLFIHWLPKPCFTYFVHRYLTVHGWVTKPDRTVTARLRNEINLLTKRELKKLFPNGEIRTERFLGLPKSYIVYTGK